MRFKRVAFYPHEGKEQALVLAERLTRWMTDRGVEVDRTAPELIVSLGGDGTMLRAAQKAHSVDALLLGVNLGALGYLTEVDAGDEEGALTQILDGRFEIEERLMLSCRCTLEGKDSEMVALNEVLVERESRHRLVRLGIRIDGRRLATYNADGVIVATPTGSTAYALSAGGPIVSPLARCMVVVPVSAHTLAAKPIVLAEEEVVEIEIAEESGRAYVSLDGAFGGPLDPGTTVTVTESSKPLRLIRLSGPGFVQRLRAKLDPTLE